ncbi:MAG TPA: DNA (cytosine-5-)-methyltransferase [Oscillatoriales cyanobacterium M59_W2019_021]|nr:MAG: DNA (cytosine-5-)-methyltransferase [Cyanobacteria bacterium J055]HIK32768.1 DNA (cytosine-5-)-methyltransferase [Oscillatoriales cyanobacterium M4454_W2019_049]HIK51872.1 DNA (cytosine-5-)-methyltransferase [Oscillatoriales cyanobacterium M59_W2019_021]
MNQSHQNLTAIELFAGIGGFRLGMKSAKIQTIWANDRSELCCRVYESNFGKNSIVQADIEEIDLSELPDHDLLTAGFPCQPFSPAGKKLGIRDRLRGTLFEKIVEIIRAKQPQYFLLENVKRILTMEKGQHFRAILNSLSSLDYFIEWRIVSPIHFGIPQNRDRVFIFGTRVDRLQDIIPTLKENSVFLTETDRLNCNLFDSSRILQPISGFTRKAQNWGLAFHNKMYTQKLEVFPDIKTRIQLKHILQNEDEVDSQFDFTEDTLKRIEQSKPVHRYYDGVEILYNQEGGARLGYTVFGINGVASTLTASTSRHYERYQVGNKFRRLTDVEYARLMGFPDDWCRVARVYDRYALYGNAVVPACVEWICQRIGQPRAEFQQPEWNQLTFSRLSLV